MSFEKYGIDKLKELMEKYYDINLDNIDYDRDTNEIRYKNFSAVDQQQFNYRLLNIIKSMNVLEIPNKENNNILVVTFDTDADNIHIRQYALRVKEILKDIGIPENRILFSMGSSKLSVENIDTLIEKLKELKANISTNDKGDIVW